VNTYSISIPTTVRHRFITLSSTKSITSDLKKQQNTHPLILLRISFYGVYGTIETSMAISKYICILSFAYESFLGVEVNDVSTNGFEFI